MKKVVKELIAISRLISKEKSHSIEIMIPYSLMDRIDSRTRKALESIADAFDGKVTKDFDSEDEGFVGKVEIFSDDLKVVKRKIIRHFNPKSQVTVKINNKELR